MFFLSADHFERGDLLSGYLQAVPFLRYSPAIVEPIGARRPQWWVFSELSTRLGFARFGSARVETQIDGRDLDDEDVAGFVARVARRSWADVLAEPYGIREDALDPGWLIPGRLRRLLDLAPPELVEQFEAGWLEQLPGAASIVLVNRRTPRQYNSFTPTMLALEPTLLVNPVDAARFGLVDGGRAAVSTAHGSLDALVRVTDTMTPGTVSLPHASTITNVNVLTTSNDADRRNAMPVLSGFAVTIAPSTPAPHRND